MLGQLKQVDDLMYMIHIYDENKNTSYLTPYFYEYLTANANFFPC